MNIIMPQLGETVAEGTVSAWHVKEGDQVKKDQPLLDVETDKASTEVPSPVEGTVVEIRVNVGETVDVGATLAVIDDGNLADSKEVTEKTADHQSSSNDEVAIQAKKDHVNSPVGRESASGVLSPAVRRLIAEHHLDPSAITGTGRDGRITRQDVEKYLSAPSQAQEPKPSAPSSLKPGSEVFTRVQKITAEHMVHSKTTSPHVLQSMEIDFSAVDRHRLSSKDQWKKDQGTSLTYLPYIAKAVTIALDAYPRLNSTIADYPQNPSLSINGEINLSIAVAVEGNELVVPVIHNANQLSVSELALKIKDLSERARTKRLTPDLMQGGTYTLSNNGSFGTLFTAPIINQPQVAILSIDRIKKQATVIENETGDSLAIRPMGILSQSFDHRAIDGAYSGGFLLKLKSVLEDSNWQDIF